MKEVSKYLAISIGVIGLFYGGFLLADYLTGTLRWRYATVHVQEYPVVDYTPLEE